MIVEYKITAKVQIFYNFQQFINHEYNKVQAYMANHGWTDAGGFCGSEIYKNIEVKLCDVFKKEFQNPIKLKQELEEIELLFGGYILTKVKGSNE